MIPELITRRDLHRIRALAAWSCIMEDKGQGVRVQSENTVMSILGIITHNQRTSERSRKV